MKKTILASLLLASAVYANDKPKNVYKLTHLSASEAIVTCQNGADPTFKNLTGNAVLVSCGATIRAEWDGKKFVCPASAPFQWADEGEALKGSDAFVYCGTHPLLGK
jgi:hypothetical protein